MDISFNGQHISPKFLYLISLADVTCKVLQEAKHNKTESIKTDDNTKTATVANFICDCHPTSHCSATEVFNFQNSLKYGKLNDTN
jgi:hypothetical protein